MSGEELEQQTAEDHTTGIAKVGLFVWGLCVSVCMITLTAPLYSIPVAVLGLSGRGRERGREGRRREGERGGGRERGEVREGERGGGGREKGVVEGGREGRRKEGERGEGRRERGEAEGGRERFVCVMYQH